MATTFLSGDILHVLKEHNGPRALAFGADCSGTLSAGIAVAVKKEWPRFAEAFLAHAEGGKLQPGDVFAWSDGPLTIMALAIQRDGAKPKFSNVERALQGAIAKATEANVNTLLVPRFAGGKTGLDWTRMRRLLIELGTGSAMQITVFEKFVRTKADDSPPQ
ncbi:MAG: hypothetical protein U0174_08960 [Polyangiaceae bacterium]